MSRATFRTMEFFLLSNMSSSHFEEVKRHSIDFYFIFPVVVLFVLHVKNKKINHVIWIFVFQSSPSKGIPNGVETKFMLRLKKWKMTSLQR